MDIILNIADNARIIAVATTLGWYVPASVDEQGNAVPAHITAQGVLRAGENYHFNLVGEVSVPTGATVTDPNTSLTTRVMTALPGQWVRVRWNGDKTRLPKLTGRSGVTVYQMVTPADGSPPFWSSDGITKAPDYVGSIGLML